MTASLTPTLALVYLHELAVDVRAAVVLDAAGEPLAGDGTLAPRARELLTAAGTRSAADGSLLAARVPDGGAIAVLAGPRAVLSLLEHDLAAAAEATATAPNLP
jgi:hypothetical protein